LQELTILTAERPVMLISKWARSSFRPEPFVKTLFRFAEVEDEIDVPSSIENQLGDCTCLLCLGGWGHLSSPIGDGLYMKLPNVNMKKIFTEYFNELHHIDIATRYADMMQSFLDKPDIAALFAGYWKEYVSQLPEAIFRQVNENFYRTTFFELCSSFLSRWLGFTVERSYPQGRSDLEFIGKYHEKFAGMRWVIEFKYFSNAELKRMKTSIEDFTLRPEDTGQLAGYVEGLKGEYPEAKIFQYVIYCFGNQGYRVFQIG